MTDRRPDIHCLGCGTYLYSLSHIESQRVSRSSPYCASCDGAVRRGMRSGAMLNRAWYEQVGGFERQLARVRKLSERDKDTIGSFGWTMRYSGTPKERRILSDPDAMTAPEWKEIAKEKLAYFKKYCSRRELVLLRALIKTAH